MRGMYAIVNMGSCFTVMSTETYDDLQKGILVETGDNYDALGKACDCLNDMESDEVNEAYFESVNW